MLADLRRPVTACDSLAVMVEGVIGTPAHPPSLRLTSFLSLLSFFSRFCFLSFFSLFSRLLSPLSRFSLFPPRLPQSSRSSPRPLPDPSWLGEHDGDRDLRRLEPRSRPSLPPWPQASPAALRPSR